MKPPIIILGCANSGTSMLARILGGKNGHFLITDHKVKGGVVPEDKSNTTDTQIWWDNFDFEKWDAKGDPQLAVPIFDKNAIERVRRIYLSLAGGKRLVIKSPDHISRVPFFKEMFPDALFVFIVRNPWHNFQSMTLGGTETYLLFTKTVLSLPDDLLLRAAHSWKECIDLYLKYKNENWTLTRYENIVYDAGNSISKMFNFLGINDSAYFERAVKIPGAKDDNYYPVRKLFTKSPYKQEIMKAIAPGCEYFNYNSSINSARSSIGEYCFARFKKMFYLKPVLAPINNLFKYTAKKVIKAYVDFVLRPENPYIGRLFFNAEAAGLKFIRVDDNTLTKIGPANSIYFGIRERDYRRFKDEKFAVLADRWGENKAILKNIKLSANHQPENGKYLLSGEVTFIIKQ